MPLSFSSENKESAAGSLPSLAPHTPGAGAAAGGSRSSTLKGGFPTVSGGSGGSTSSSDGSGRSGSPPVVRLAMLPGPMLADATSAAAPFALQRVTQGRPRRASDPEVVRNAGGARGTLHKGRVPIPQPSSAPHLAAPDLVVTGQRLGLQASPLGKATVRADQLRGSSGGDNSSSSSGTSTSSRCSSSTSNCTAPAATGVACSGLAPWDGTVARCRQRAHCRPCPPCRARPAPSSRGVTR
eukprot:m.244852 g.244852  ORF g.244852 m.244852 type:complete len:240 (+) comp22564_c6_seq1:187-906(+)